jgi:hypothetical protein
MRTLLIILIAFVGMTSSLIGLLLIAYPVLTAYDLSMDFLHPDFSKNFVVPGVIFIIIGSINLSALFNSMQRSKNQYIWSLAGGLLMLAWVVIHSALLRTIPWLYLTYLIFGLLIVLISWQLKGKWAV